jgi:oligosaccharide repeat unit polymerase
MSLLLSVIVLSGWLILMYRYGRTILFPPAVLTLVWAATLLGLFLCGDMYYPVLGSTIWYVLAGVFAYSIGGVLVVRLPKPNSFHLSRVKPQRVAFIQRLVRWMPFLLLANFPFFLSYLGQLSSTIAPRESLWRQIRMASIHANATGGGLHFEASILPLISFAALLAVFEWTESGKNGLHTLATLLLAVLYHLLNGSRSDVLLLSVSAVTIYWVRSGKAPKKILATVVLGFAFIFTLNQVAMGKFGADSNDTAAENSTKVLQGTATYWLGGIVAFDQFRQNPSLKYGWDLNSFAIRLANKFGGEFLQHDRDLQYTKVSPTQSTNVYSIFLPYYMQTYTLTSVVLLMFLVGAVSTYTYRSALGGTCWATFVLGTLIFATMMTFFSDEFFAQITFMAKMAFLSTAVYFMPPLRRSIRATDRELAQEGSSVCG